MSLLVHNPGMLATVQDLGREGFGSAGVSQSGAADTLSLRVGNRLLANADGAAAVEMTLVGGSYEFTRATPFVIAGARCDARLRRRDGTSAGIRMWSPTAALPGDVLHVGAIGGAGEGCRGYVCVMGGIDTPRVMGSRSTQVGTMVNGGVWAGGMGGVACASGVGCGAPLHAGEVLAIGARAEHARTRLISGAVRARCQEAIARRVIRVTPGPQWEMLAGAARASRDGLFAARRVLDRFDRRGVRLTPGIESAQRAGAIATQPTEAGFIQVPGPDELIVLGPDGPPTGGYPVVACVASVDMPSLGQLRAHDAVRFEVVGVERGRELLRELWRDVDRDLEEVA